MPRSFRLALARPFGIRPSRAERSVGARVVIAKEPEFGQLVLAQGLPTSGVGERPTEVRVARDRTMRATRMPAAQLSPLQQPSGQRIVLIGCGGSGKTYLANQLGKRLDFVVTHLDGHSYDPEWNRKPAGEFAALQHELVAGDQWIVEGNYASTLPIRLCRADTVIFLDISPLTCLAGILQRRWRYGGGQHTEVGVYDRITWNFIRYILGYRRSMRPRVLRLINEHAQHARVITLTSRAAASRFLQQIKPGPRWRTSP